MWVDLCYNSKRMDYPQMVASYINQFSYLAIFILTFFSGYIIPVPEEIVLIVIGYLASQNFISLPVAIIICIISLIASDNFVFRLCLTNNRYIKKMHDQVFRLRLMKYRAQMEKHIDKTIFYSRFTPFLRFVGPVLAATVKTPKKDFFVFNSFAVIIYAPILILVGFFFSAHISILISKIESVHQWIFHWALIGLMVLFGVWITHYINKRLGDPLNATVGFSKEEEN
jgi:membrane-associated protein